VKAVAGAVIGLVLLGALAASCVALVNDEDSSGPAVVLVSHDYCAADHDGCGDDWGGGSDGNTGYDGEGGRSGDTDQRGDHNCRNFCFYGVPMPGDGGGGSEPATLGARPPLDGTGLPGGGGPRSLFPPTPEGIRAFVLATMEAGLGLGRLFADATIDFVSTILVGIA
jgi:hypothetical protein